MSAAPVMPAPPPVPMRWEEGRLVDPFGSRLLVGVLGCEKYRERADGVRQSWMRLVPATTQVLFLHGRPDRPEGIEGDVLYLDVPETYEDLPRKVNRFLRYAVEHLDFDHLFKTDDDTYLDLPRFLGFDRGQADYIGQFREHPVGERGRTWHYGKCTDPAREVPWEGEFVCPWATGGGYFLSRRAAERAAERTEATCRGHLFEDMMVGEALTMDPELRVLMTQFRAMGVINPLLPKDMLHVQDMVLEREALTQRLAACEAELGALRAHSGSGAGPADP